LQTMTETQINARDKLLAVPTEENFWQAVVAFQSYPFYTASGLPFTYTIKTGKKGQFTKELIIDRRENSKTLTWSSIMLAFQKVVELRQTENKPALFDRPKAIGDIRGISYAYPLLWRFGLIEVSEKIEEKLNGCNV